MRFRGRDSAFWWSRWSFVLRFCLLGVSFVHRRRASLSVNAFYGPFRAILGPPVVVRSVFMRPASFPRLQRPLRCLFGAFLAGGGVLFWARLQKNPRPSRMGIFLHARACFAVLARVLFRCFAPGSRADLAFTARACAFHSYLAVVTLRTLCEQSRVCSRMCFASSSWPKRPARHSSHSPLVRVLYLGYGVRFVGYGH